jgi:hypothetical protein
MKTIDIKNAYNLINTAKLTKLSSTDKFKVIKAIRVLKQIATDFEEFQKDAMERLKGEEHDDIVAKATQWKSEGENTTLTTAERIRVNTYLLKYQKDVDQCISDEANKDNELTYDRLSEEALGQFLDSNDFAVSDILLIQDALG